MIKTRFAPSPTGALHIGGVRTALYEYLVAKKGNGTFSLRIEDTDRARIVEDSPEDIIETLNWLGLEVDGEPIFQSKRADIYKEHAKKLVMGEFAYEQDGAIYFKTKKEGKTSIVDLVGNRKIEFDNATQDDFVILKSDGFPTYHLAHVVDDHLMETNPVIRGAEWISSIPKHVMLFEAFGWELPQYAHLPIILGPDKSKLSKRHGAKPASEFRKDGFLPEAILNFMALTSFRILPIKAISLAECTAVPKVMIIAGPNGSGKSTLAHAVMGHPKYKITTGSIVLKGKDITNEKPHIRAREGLFLSFQYPVEISGVTVSTFLRTALNSLREKPLSVVEFHQFLKEKMLVPFQIKFQNFFKLSRIFFPAVLIFINLNCKLII